MPSANGSRSAEATQAQSPCARLMPTLTGVRSTPALGQIGGAEPLPVASGSAADLEQRAAPLARQTVEELPQLLHALGRRAAAYEARVSPVPITVNHLYAFLLPHATEWFHPRFALEQATVDRARAVLAKPDLAPGVRRGPVDATDDLQRALRAREVRR